MRIRPGLWPTSAGRLAWRLLQLLATLTLIWGAWRLLGHTPYRIDIDVYRMGGRAWLNNTPLYSESTIFHTQAGIDLPFTYPPLAAIMFAPFAWLPLPGASVAITVTTFVLLLVSGWVLLRTRPAAGWSARKPGLPAPSPDPGQPRRRAADR